jgi:hydrogenase 3 maturation protease
VDQNIPLRVAILGVGNELNGDDAAGVLVARILKSKLHHQCIQADALRTLSSQQSNTADIMVIEAGPSPESFTGPLRRFKPDLVLLVDAANLGQPAGAFQWVEWHNADGMSASTHTLPPNVLARFLVEELSCRVILVGIQPAHLDFDRPVSIEVLRAVESVADDIAQKYNFMTN